MKTIDINNKDSNVRTYATRANLIKGIEKFGLTEIRHIVVNTEDGRWTAIFLVSEYFRDQGGYIAVASQHGFMSV